MTDEVGTTVQVTVDDQPYNVAITAKRDLQARWGKRSANIFLDGYPKPTLETPGYSLKGEDPELDAEWRRYNREELRLMRPFAEAAAVALNDAADPETLRFDRKTGCGCGCSPGFRVRQTERVPQALVVYVHIELAQ